MAFFCHFPINSFPPSPAGEGGVGGVVGSKALGCSCSSMPQGPAYNSNVCTHHLQKAQAGAALTGGLEMGLATGVWNKAHRANSIMISYSALRSCSGPLGTNGTIWLSDPKPLQQICMAPAE